MSDAIYINGEFCTPENAKISVFDHGLLYGDGVFEGIRFYEKNIFRLEEHLDRLQSSAKYLILKIPLDREALIEAVKETCRRSGLEDGYIRLIVTRGTGTLGLNPFACNNPSLIIIVSKIRLYPEEFYENGMPIIVAATRRYGSDVLAPRVKSLNYLNNILAKMEAIHAGVQEALMLDNQGFIVECTGDNIFIVKDQVVFTPPIYQGALRGITRDVVLELAHEAGFETRQERFSLYEAYDADECFLTGTAAEIVPVIDIDQRPIGDAKPGAITKELTRRFKTITGSDGVPF
jgi:branched-chain amino acid aminotransferase